MLYRLPRFVSEAAVDRAYTGHELRALALYMTAQPNCFFDVSESRARKHRALDAYRTQLSDTDLQLLHSVLEQKERAWAAGRGFEFAEALKVLAPAHLHVNPDAEEMFSAVGAPPRAPSS